MDDDLQWGILGGTCIVVVILAFIFWGYNAVDDSSKYKHQEKVERIRVCGDIPDDELKALCLSKAG